MGIKNGHLQGLGTVCRMRQIAMRIIHKLCSSRPSYCFAERAFVRGDYRPLAWKKEHAVQRLCYRHYLVAHCRSILPHINPYSNAFDKTILIGKVHVRSLFIAPHSYRCTPRWCLRQQGFKKRGKTRTRLMFKPSVVRVEAVFITQGVDTISFLCNPCCRDELQSKLPCCHSNYS